MTNTLIALFIWTNLADVCNFSPSREDANAAIGAVVTSTVPPFIAAPAPDPTPMPNGIEAPVLVLTDDNGVGYGVIVDGGDLLTYQDHASPRPSEAVLRQRIQQARAYRAALRRDARTVRANMVANIQTMQGAAALTNGFTATQNRALINDIRRELIDTQQEVRDLTAILRKMLKDSEP